MTASPAPPPGLPRKPGPFDAPFWGWACALGFPLFGLWLVIRTREVDLFYASLPRYVAYQVDPERASRFWAVVERLVGVEGVWAPVLAIVLCIIFLAAGLARYRAAAVLATLGLLTWQHSGSLLRPLFWPGAGSPPVSNTAMALTTAWQLELSRLALSLLVAGAALFAWRRWRAGRGAAPSPLPMFLVVVVMPLLGWAMISGRTTSMAPSLVWESGWVFLDYMLPFLGMPLLVWLGMVAMMEGFGALKPRPRLVLGIWAVAVLATGVVAGRSPPPEAFGSTESWPLFATGGEVRGTALVWWDSSRWAFEPRDFHPEVTSAVRNLLLTGRVAEPTLPAMSAPMPSWVALKADPFSPAQDYISILRRANPGLDTLLPALVMSTILKQRPLTDEEADDWLNLVTTMPSHLAEDIALLGNLVGSGRRDRAESLAAHIRGTLALFTPSSKSLTSSGSEASINGRFLVLLAAYEEAIAALPAPDGLQRSVAVRLVTEAGLPLAGVPVGLYQSLRLGRPEHPGGMAKVGRLGVGYSASGLFVRTDANGEALFESLHAVGYGSTVFAGWPDAGLEAGRMAVPLSDLPDPLPPGPTTQVWKVLPSGTFRGNNDGPLTLDPEPTGPVAWVCQLEAANEGTDCPKTFDLQKAIEEGVGRSTNLPPIVALGPYGRPRFVWWFSPEETTAAEDAPAPADDTP